MEIIIIGLLIVGMVICLIVIWVSSIKIEKCKTNLERNQAVFHFRMKILNESLEKFRKLPSYEEMFKSDLAITDENFLK